MLDLSGWTPAWIWLRPLALSSPVSAGRSARYLAIAARPQGVSCAPGG